MYLVIAKLVFSLVYLRYADRLNRNKGFEHTKLPEAMIEKFADYHIH